MSGRLILYHLDMSPASRAVRTVAKLLSLELELRDVDSCESEYLGEAFLRINPEHTVPTLDDNGFIIWDCHAICGYLVEKYARDDRFYPRDQRLRAKCNQRMFFNASNLSVRLIDIGKPIYFDGCTEIPKDKVDPIVISLDILEQFLTTDPFLVGTQLTIADICVAVIVPLLAVFTPMSNSKYPNILAWLQRVSQVIPFYDEMNARYPLQYRQLIQDNLQRNRQNR